MSRKPPPTKDPTADRETIEGLREAVTVVRATPYDLVVLWTEEGVSEADVAEVYEMADALAESTGAILAVLPRKVFGEVSSYSLLEAMTLRTELGKIVEQLDDVIVSMATNQSRGEA